MRDNHHPMFPVPIVQAHLPATILAPRQARATVRRALDDWGLNSISADAQLLTSELVANAAEHADGMPIGLTIYQHAEPGGRRGILCQVTDTGPGSARARAGRWDSERGRGLQIVAAIAARSGITTIPGGTTAWFTLTAPPGPSHAAVRSDPEPEMEAGT